MSSYLVSPVPEDQEGRDPEGVRPGTGTDPGPAWLDRVSRIRTTHLQRLHDEGGRFAMLTSYDALTAQIFDEAGIEVLLVGDSVANTVLGLDSTVPLDLLDFLPFVRAVARGARRAMVVADLPFGTYEESPAQAVRTGVRLLKEGGAHAVKMEGGAYYAEHVRAMVQAGIPVMAHVGFTPQSENVLGGYRVQGRQEAAAAVREDALALEEAGAFAVLMEMTTTAAADDVVAALRVPTVGIGAGASTTGQVLVWQDMAGLSGGRAPRFVKKYADLRGSLAEAAGRFREDVVSGRFPAPEHAFTD